MHQALLATTEPAMPIYDIPLFSMLRTRMQWHQERQQVLADNLANADMPKFKPHDLAPPEFNQSPQFAPASAGLVRTDAGHLTGLSGNSSTQFKTTTRNGYEVRPSGNSVDLEEEMIKVAANQMDYQAATTLYSRSLNLLKTALGKR
jgi:flagellar basal-body rod protein FlgB